MRGQLAGQPTATMSRARLEIALLAVALLALTPLVAGDGEDASGAVRKPNIVLITTDDQTLASLRVMDRVQRAARRSRGHVRERARDLPALLPVAGELDHRPVRPQPRRDRQPGAQRGRLPGAARARQGAPRLARRRRLRHRAGRQVAARLPHPRPGPGMGSLLGADRTDDGQLLRLRGHRLARRAGSATAEDADDYLTDALTRDYALPYIRAARSATPTRSSSTSPTSRRTGAAVATTPPGAAARTASRSRSRPRRRSRPRATPAPSARRSCRRRRRSTRPTCPTSRGRCAGASALRRREIREITERYRCELASLLAVDRGVARSTAALDEAHLSRAHLRDLHLRQRLHARRAPDPGREGAALRGGAQGAAGDPPARRSRPGSRSTIRSPTSTSRRRSSSSPRSRCPTRSQRPVDGRSLAPYTYGRGDPDRAVLIEAKRPPRRSATGDLRRPLLDRRAHPPLPLCRALPGRGPDPGRGLRPRDRGRLGDRRRALRPRRDPHELDQPPRRFGLRVTRAALAGAVGELRRCAGEACRFDLSVPPPSLRAAADGLKPRRTPPIQGLMFDIDAALRTVVESEGSDLHLKVPSPPMIRIHGELGPIPGGRAADARGHRGRPAPHHQRRRPARGVRQGRRGRLLLLDPRRLALPRQRLPPARHGRDRLSRDPVPGPDDRGPRAARR